MLLYLSSHPTDGSTIFPMIRGPNTQNTSLVAPIDLKLRTKGAMAPYCDTDQFFKVDTPCIEQLMNCLWCMQIQPVNAAYVQHGLPL